MKKDPQTLAEVYYTNAVRILQKERIIRKKYNQSVYGNLSRGFSVKGGILDFLSNPFVKFAMKILEPLQSNYRIREALRLLQAAGEEAEKENKKRRK